MLRKTDTLNRLDEMIYRNLNSTDRRARARLSRVMRVQNHILSYRKTAGKLPGRVGKS